MKTTEPSVTWFQSAAQWHCPHQPKSHANISKPRECGQSPQPCSGRVWYISHLRLPGPLGSASTEDLGEAKSYFSPRLGPDIHGGTLCWVGRKDIACYITELYVSLEKDARMLYLKLCFLRLCYPSVSWHRQLQIQKFQDVQRVSHNRGYYIWLSATNTFLLSCSLRSELMTEFPLKNVTLFLQPTESVPDKLTCLLQNRKTQSSEWNGTTGVF